ncbi:MAG: acyl-CoA dehydrogenase family protein [Burkholderiales bacterium]
MRADLSVAELAALPDADFRAHVRGWLRENLPPGMVERSRTAVHPTREDMLGVSAVLARRGWSVPTWPVAHGGTGWSAMRCQWLEEELVLAGGSANNIQGVSLAGPVIAEFGTPAQQARYLPAIREGREFWSQGFSEPNAGSDLASLRTRAVLDGDHWVVDGQKIWTSQAMMADMLFCLVRTDPSAKPQLGISFLLIPMTLPGITVRPIRSIDEGESLCEVFFDAVRVPADALVGQLHRGWDCAKYLLARERVQTAEVPRNKLYLSRLRAIAGIEQRDGRPLIEDPVFAERVAQAEIDLIALESAVAQALTDDDVSALTPSALKVVGCELMQRQLGLQVEALGTRALVFHPPEEPAAHGAHALHAAGVVAEFLFRRAATIYGGSSEIQKNIMARLLFQGDGQGGAARAGETALLADSAGRYASGELGAAWRERWPQLDRAAHRQAWQALAAQGFGALGLPESLGGAGGGGDALAAVQEAFGAALLPYPFAALSVLPGQLLAALPAEAGRITPLLDALACGDTLFAVAGALPDQPMPQVEARPEGLRLRGPAQIVPGAGLADQLLVCAEQGGHTAVYCLPADHPGLRLRPGRAIDGSDLAEVALDGVALDTAQCLAGPDAATTAAVAAARDHALVAACADAIGAMAAALALTRDYLLTRRQFGQPLAEFQALRHRVAEMHAELTMARAVVARAAPALAGEAPAERARLAAACKARVGRAAMFIANQTVQLHGGMGMTEACLAGRFYKRLFSLEAAMGNAVLHSRRFAALPA